MYGYFIQENLDRVKGRSIPHLKTNGPHWIALTIPPDQMRSYNPNPNSLVSPIVHTLPPDYVCEISPEPIVVKTYANSSGMATVDATALLKLARAFEVAIEDLIEVVEE